MKKYLPLILLLCLASCTKDEEEEQAPTKVEVNNTPTDDWGV